MSILDSIQLIKKYEKLQIKTIEKGFMAKELNGWGKSKLSRIISFNFLLDYADIYLRMLESNNIIKDEEFGC